jgi:hypothetical protein
MCYLSWLRVACQRRQREGRLVRKRIFIVVIAACLLVGAGVQVLTAVRWDKDRGNVATFGPDGLSFGYLTFDNGRVWQLVRSHRGGWNMLQAIDWPHADIPPPRQTPEAFRAGMINTFGQPSEPKEWARVASVVTAHSASQFAKIDLVQVGWPARCLEFIHADYRAGAAVTARAAVTGGKTLRGTDTIEVCVRHNTISQLLNGRWTADALPTAVIWPGMMINATCFAATGALLAWSLQRLLAWRATRRRTRGLCPHCAYPRNTTTDAAQPCSECGRAWA